MPALAVAQGIRLTTDTFPQKPDKRQVRVLLIARTVGDWWADLNEKTETLREQMILEKAEHVHLDTLARTDNDFKTHYDAAIQAFSKELKVFAPATQSAAINENSPILVIHMAALIAVLGFEGLPPDRRSKLLSQLLFHEEKYWLWSAESRGFADLGRAVRRQSVTVLCLSGAVTEADVEELLKRVPKLADASAVRLSVADWLRGLYPGDGGVLGSLQPHLLAEYLVVSELADRTFSNTALSGLPENGARNAFTVLGHAAQHDDKADSLIREAVEADPARLILPAISAAVDTGVVLDSEFANVLDGMSLSLTQLIQLSATIPLESRSLTAAATVIRGRLAEAGIAELRRTKRSATGHPEIMPRQTLLTELLRVDEFSRKRGLALPDSFRSELIKALGRQRRALTSAGQISEARGISQKLKEIQALDSPPDQRPTL